MADCIFCDIVEGGINSTIIYEDELILGFMDIYPVNDGHMLLITKNHKLDLDELTDEESSRIMKVSKILVRVLKKKYNLDGYSIMQNGGAFNDIGHYHLHVFPRYKDDGFRWAFKEIIPIDIKEVGKELAAEVTRLIDNKH